MEAPRKLIPLNRPIVDDGIETYQRDGVVYDSRDGMQPMLSKPNIPVGSPVDADIWPVI